MSAAQNHALLRRFVSMAPHMVAMLPLVDNCHINKMTCHISFLRTLLLFLLLTRRGTRWWFELYLAVSQDICAHLAMRALMVVLSRPSVSTALFNLHPGDPLATPAHQVIKKKTLVHSHVFTEETKVIKAYSKMWYTTLPRFLLHGGFICGIPVSNWQHQRFIRQDVPDRLLPLPLRLLL